MKKSPLFLALALAGAALALLAAAKVAQSELDQKNDLALVDSFLSESGEKS